MCLLVCAWRAGGGGGKGSHSFAAFGSSKLQISARGSCVWTFHQGNGEQDVVGGVVPGVVPSHTGQI